MELLIILLLMLLNGLFSMSEIAVVSSRKTRLQSAAKAGKTGAETALELSSSPERFLSTVQIGITLIGLLTGIYSGENITNDLEVYLSRYEMFSPIADGLAVTIVLVATTFLTVVLKRNYTYYIIAIFLVHRVDTMQIFRNNIPYRSEVVPDTDKNKIAPGSHEGTDLPVT